MYVAYIVTGYWRMNENYDEKEEKDWKIFSIFGHESHSTDAL